MKLSVREIKASDIESIINYFHNATPEFLLGMGVKKENLPDKVEWTNLLLKGLEKKKADREFYFIRGAEGKSLVVVAVEVKDKNSGRVRLSKIPDASSKSLIGFIEPFRDFKLI